MKLLFLDIDGVMTSNSLNTELGKEEKLYHFSHDCVEALNAVLRMNKVKIILTSSWRTVFNVEKQCRVFKENGVAQMPKDQTIDLGYENRAMEIQMYLKNRIVEGFVILDDMEIKGFEGHFLRINPSTGLTESHIQEINEILNRT